MSPTETQMNRARYIRTVLAFHDFTQSDLGRLLNCTQVSAGRKLRGQRRFTEDELLVIADTFGLDPANMLRPPALEAMLGAVRMAGNGTIESPEMTSEQSPFSVSGSYPRKSGCSCRRAGRRRFLGPRRHRKRPVGARRI